ncbi:MAG: NAD(P)/FAD-dependent oxidoreductase, partial [Verrucomicrobiae bacterium]|nr:NAD(P)/FAD-dependent oxidoreductase [Verrucomicrobiae bacterium]
MESVKTEVVVVGGGPGGYAAAFYAADKGMQVILVERERRLGGVCLNYGCIPSKALLHATKVIKDAEESARRGIAFGAPQVNLAELRIWKDSVVERLAKGIAGLAEKRGVAVWHGRGYFEDSQTLRVETAEGQRYIRFEHAIVAVGSRAALPKAFDLGNPRVMTSTEALDLPDVPSTLLVIGGGYIGMELGTVYARLGSLVVVVEALEHVLSGADSDLTQPVMRRAEKAFREMRVRTKVLSMATAGKQIRVVMETDGRQREEVYDRVLVAVGRAPNCDDLGLENTKVQCDEKGFIKVNAHQQTADPAIYAIGDIVGGPLLAHKAAREARVAVDVIAGDEDAVIENYVIPAVVFTDPEVAWAGLTEAEARAKWTRDAGVAARANPPLRHGESFPGRDEKARDTSRLN